MLFKSIELYNFGRYYGSVLFDTAVTQDKNVILVNAKNDRGKTTLFMAIKFALYGNIPNFRVEEWANFQSAAERDGKMYVEIKFMHGSMDSNIYLLRRSVDFRQTDKGKEITVIKGPNLELFKDDMPFMVEKDDTESTRQSWINGILPLDASQFFFFDGEKIQQYMQNKEDSVKKAIEEVLGIKELSNARTDLSKVYEDLKSDYEKKVRENARDKKDKNKLVELSNRIDEEDESIRAKCASLKDAEKREEEFTKDLKKFESIKNLVEKRSDTEKQIEGLSKDLDEAEKTLTANRANLSLILAQPLLDLINKTEDNPPTMDRWQSDTVKYILNKNLDNCVCGHPIDPDTRKALEAKILELKPSKESELKMFANKMLIELNPKEKHGKLVESLEKISNIKQNIDKQKSTKSDYTEQINDVGGDAGEINELEKKHEEVKNDIAVWKDDLERIEHNKKNLKAEKEKLVKKIESSVVNEEFKAAKQRRDMCQKYINCVNSAIDRFYEKRKPVIEHHISNTFTKLTNNPELYKGLEINRDFNIGIIRNDDVILPTHKYGPSAGASQIVATAMIGGLNRFATKDAPIVIDTPMGRLDPIHREKLINYYSEMGRQIIILYQPSELSSDDIQKIDQNISSEWVIESVPNHPERSQIKRKESHL